MVQKFWYNIKVNQHIIKLRIQPPVYFQVDNQSIPFVKGATIDFVESMIKSGFEVRLSLFTCGPFYLR